MAMFRRDKNEPKAVKPPSPPTPARRPTAPQPSAGVPDRRGTPPVKTTLIAPGSRFEGTLSGPTELRIEGEVEGHVKPDNHVEIGPQGRVVGDVTARSARISGHVIGNVLGREVVELTETGRLEGDVKAPRVIISEGAFFRGNVQMGEVRPQQKKVAGS